MAALIGRQPIGCRKVNGVSLHYHHRRQGEKAASPVVLLQRLRRETGSHVAADQMFSRSPLPAPTPVDRAGISLRGRRIGQAAPAGYEQEETMAVGHPRADLPRPSGSNRRPHRSATNIWLMVAPTYAAGSVPRRPPSSVVVMDAFPAPGSATENMWSSANPVALPLLRVRAAG